MTNITTPKLIVFSHSLSFENWIYLLFNCSVISDSLRSHGLQPTRPPCPSLSLGVYSKLMAIESMMPPKHLILCHPLLLPSIFPSIRVFSNESTLRIRWPKYWSFSFSICPSNEYSGLISFRIDWFDLLTVQGTLEGLLRHHSLKASVLWHSAFFMVQLSHPCMTTGKTIALTVWTFVGTVISLLFNVLSRFVITFLRSNHFLSLYSFLSEVNSLSRVRLFATLWTVARQAPLSMGFSRRECWSGLPFLPSKEQALLFTKAVVSFGIPTSNI